MENKLYLKKAKLSGYKSIEDVEIDFQKGLNIIIGKNAAGKTNFLSFLNKAISFDFQDLSNFTSFLLFENGKEFSIDSSKNVELDDLFNSANLNSEVETILKVSNKIVKDKKSSTIQEKLQNKKLYFDNSFLCHGIPNEYLVVDKPATFTFEIDKISNQLSKIFRGVNNPYFLRSFTLDLIFVTFDIKELEENYIEKKLNNLFDKYKKMSGVFSTYTPIEDLRISDNFNLFIDKEKNNFVLSNLFFEFKVDGQWLPFSNLSDGTKRLFYIISEIYDDYFVSSIRPTTCGFFTSKEDISRIILLEEPELGIHPHQFHKLLEFLKVESKTKQLIITTHSPQALDSIDENELSRIIMAYSNNSSEGTKLRHLDDKELSKAKEYIKENFLSDYWLYSDLEK